MSNGTPSVFSVQVTPGYIFKDGERITPAILRLIAKPKVDVRGTVTAATIPDGSISPAKLTPNFITSLPLVNTPGADHRLILQDTTAGVLSQTKVSAIAIAGLPGLAVAPDTLVATDAVAVLTGGAAYRETITKVVKLGMLDQAVLSSGDATVLPDDGMWAFAGTTSKGVRVRDVLNAVSNLGGITAGAVAQDDVLLIVDINATGGNANRVRKITVADLSTVLASQVKETPTPLAVPAPGGTADFAHNLSAVPRQVSWVLRCESGDAGHTAGTEIPLEACLTENLVPGFLSWRTASACWVRRTTAANLYVAAPTGGAYFTLIAPGSWRLICRATK